MRTNPDAIRVLIYGDSLTYGKIPWWKRYPVHIRFTGQLQELLGDGYDIIEEWQRWRLLAGENAFYPHRDGLQAFQSICGSHAPINVVVLMLGTNDCNAWQTKSYDDYYRDIQWYQKSLETWCAFLGCQLPHVLLVSPPHIDPVAGEWDPSSKFRWAAEKSHELTAWYARIAEHMQRGYLDMSSVVYPSLIDGIHLDEVGNTQVAKALFESIYLMKLTPWQS